MKVTIGIDSGRCILCGRCAAVCPSMLFELKEKTMTACQYGCIGCGQCVAVCPQDAIVHSSFHESRICKFDADRLPDSDSLMLLLKCRRSNRAFSDKTVPSGLLDRIVEAGRYAPTAENCRDVRMLLITDPDKIKALSDFTMDTYVSLLKLLDNPIVRPLLKMFSQTYYDYVGTFRKLKKEHESGNDQILRHAKAVILYYTPSGSRFGCQDANLAYQNSSLMAASLGVAHFYTGFVCVAASMRKRKLQRLVGVEGTVHAGMALALPRFGFGKYIVRE
ncbi:MAG: nitroreductase family protein [Candidatus Aphodosoma sp.]